MAVYLDDNGNEITFEAWKIAKEKKEKAKIKEKKKADEPVKKFEGNRELAKRTYDFIKRKGAVDQDYETWLSGLAKGGTSYKAKLHGFLVDEGAVTQDYNAWSKGYGPAETGKTEKEIGPTFLVDGKTLDINGVEVEVADKRYDRQTGTDFEGELKNIQFKTDELISNPLTDEEGKLDTVATNKAIKEIQASSPSILQVNDEFDGDNLTEEEAKEFDSLVGPLVPFQIDKISGDVSFDRGDSDDDQNIEDKRKEAMAKIIASRQERLDLYNKGELDLTSEELMKISKINPEVESYLKDKMPEFNELETKQDLQEAYANTINTAASEDPRFSSITTDIKNNINTLSNDKWTEIGDKYDILDEGGFELAQQEYTDWYNTEFQTRLGENKEAVKLFTEYGVSGEQAFAKVARDFDRQLVDSEQEDSLRPDWMPENSLLGGGLDLWDDLFSTRTADKLYNMAGFDIDLSLIHI